MKFNRIGILLGGLSREREVSLAGGKAVSRALQNCGYQVVEIDVTHQLDKQLRAADIDAAFIVLHGRHGEDGTVQGMLEMMQIPYTGSNVLASALAIDKAKTRRVLSDAGIRVAPGVLLTKKNQTNLPSHIQLPVVVKPAEEGSSVGVSIAKTAADYAKALEEAFACSKNVLVEQFIAGKEVQVAVLGERVLGAVEIEPHREFYDYSAKYEPGGSTHHIPPRIADSSLQTLLSAGKEVFDAVGCAGAARVDFILTDTGDVYCLEINTIPGMTETSLLPEIAAHAGLNFEQLVTEIIESAALHV
ncbi:MAG: D-alanine--D-alanine ligase [Deltaproteobacteria bacterium]|nr:D-alanine--D-alanine ligase [Deltaproteobacteria bacterium]MBN2673096.1 D-alanine--D-alanine ligase [Deltaproteobacteria bacterium]